MASITSYLTTQRCRLRSFNGSLCRAANCGQSRKHRVAQVRPFQIIDRRDQSRVQPAAFLHLRSLQSFTPMTAASLGQVLEGAGFLSSLSSPLEEAEL